MMKRIKVVGTIVLLMLAVVIPNAMATTIDGTSLQTVLNNMTIGPSPGSSSVNVNTDQVANDAYWSIAGSGGAIATFVIELAGFADVNKFGIFQGTKEVQVFGGAASNGDMALISIMADGSVRINGVDTLVDFTGGNNFGFYLKNPLSTFYSDTTKNSDGFDHMVAFRGEGDTIQIPPYSAGVWSGNEYVLAWEDLPGGVSDRDYNDMVVMIESVNPVPEPATLLLLGSGLLGCVALARLRGKKTNG